MGDVAFVVPSAHLVTEIEVLDVDGFPVETEAPIQWTGTMHKASVSAPAGSEVTLRYRAEDLYHRDLGWSQEMSPGIVASDAQNVPEPGLTASLIVGGLFLAWAGKRRTKIVAEVVPLPEPGLTARLIVGALFLRIAMKFRKRNETI